MFAMNFRYFLHHFFNSSLAWTIVFACVLHQFVASSSKGVSEIYRKQDRHGNYKFGYGIKDGFGSENFRKESGDADNNKWGSYGLKDSDGRWRIVHYVADKHGFRVKMDTNEPGVGHAEPADVIVNKHEEDGNYGHPEPEPEHDPSEHGPSSPHEGGYSGNEYDPSHEGEYYPNDISPQSPHPPSPPSHPILHEGIVEGILDGFKAASSSNQKTTSNSTLAYVSSTANTTTTVATTVDGANVTTLSS